MKISLAKLSWKTQVAVFLAVSLALAGAFYYYWVQPLQADMEIRRGKLATLKVDINKGLTTARQLPAFRKQVTELEARLVNLRAVLPEQKDVGDLLRRLQTLATQASLQIKGFKPAAIATKQMHAEWPINLELDGTYHHLGRFFDQVAKFSRIINISNIHIKAKDKPTSESTISIECVATTFVLLEPGTGKKTAPVGPKQRKPARAAPNAAE
jgi:type IV pilus assembly protein PilO